MRGQFVFLNLPKHPPKIIIPNMIVDDGEEAFLQMIAQGNNVILPAGNNFYIGLCNQAPAETDDLSTITTEPGATGGYARQAIARSAVGFPTLFQANGVWGIRSALITFTATGVDFDTAFTRAFLCNVASGSAGVLFAFSGPLLQAVTVAVGAPFNMYYELFLD